MFIGESTLTGHYLGNVQAEAVEIDNAHEAMIAATAVDEANFNAIMAPFAVAELNALREGADPFTTVYTEGTLSSFWEKVKAFFKKVWAKIKGIFAKVMTRLDSQFRSGKSFWDKYNKELASKFAKIDKDKVKFVGYSYDVKKITDDVANPAYGALQSANSLSDNDSDEDEKALDGYRGETVGQSSLSANEYSKELQQYFRGGDTTKSEVGGVNLSYIASFLSSDKLISDVKKNFHTLEKACEDSIKTAEKKSKTNIDKNVEASKGDDNKAKENAQKAVSSDQHWLVIARGRLAIAQQYVGAQASAIQSAIGQAKGFAGQVLRASVKEGAALEGAYGSNDIFGSVKLK